MASQLKAAGSRTGCLRGYGTTSWVIAEASATCSSILRVFEQSSGWRTEELPGGRGGEGGHTSLMMLSFEEGRRSSVPPGAKEVGSLDLTDTLDRLSERGEAASHE